jgi:nucleoid DNA-binding protein
MDIRKSIAELLSLHDCVIIPGFGGFIGNYCPARVDFVTHTFHPPSKQLLFNINLKQNDGLLANEVSATFGVSYTDAFSMIDKFSEECRFTLKSGKPCILPQIGKLYPGTEGIIHFEQEPGANLLADAFGLTAFISPPVIRSSKALHSEWQLPHDETHHEGKKFILPRALKWAAAIALPVGIATVIGVTQYDRISANFTSNAGILGSAFTRFSSASLVEKKTAPVKLKTVIAMPAVKIPVVEKTPAISHEDRFAVIVGAFKLQENAEKLVNELNQKGVKATIFDQSKTGLFRVTIGTSSDRADVRQLLASAKTADISGAWILAK